MGYEGHSLRLTHRGTHHHVWKAAPKLAAFLYALCQVNKPNIDSVCFNLVTTTLVLLACISNQGLGNCPIWWSLLLLFNLIRRGRNKGRKKKSRPKLMLGSCQPLLKCHGAFIFLRTLHDCWGKRWWQSNNRKITHTELCSTVPNPTLPVLVKKAKFLRLPVRSQLVLLWIFLLHGNEAEVHGERQMARSNVTYPNVHVRQRAFWHTSRSMRHVGQRIPAKCLFPSTFYSCPQQVRSYLSSVFTWITLDVFQRF